MRNKVLILCLVLVMGFTYQGVSPQSSRDVMVVNENGKKELRSERLAIVIGINNYVHLPTLHYAVSDARSIKETLESKGNFNVEYYADDYSINPPAGKPNKENIMSVIRDAEYSVRKGWIKTLVVYFAGHGFENNEIHYLAPIGSHRGRLSEFINVEEVISILNEARKKAKVILFLDACRENDPFARSSMSDAWYSDLDSNGLAILRSTDGCSLSYETPDLCHGVYTYYLNKGLLGEADYDYDGFVSYNELDRYVWEGMREWSLNNVYGKKQRPRSTVDKKYGAFFITKTGEGGGGYIPNNLRGVKYRDMVRVNGGTFTQKGIGWDESDVHSFRHTVSSFEIGKYEVTYELWYAVYKWAIKNGYHFANAGMEGSVTGGGDWPNYNNVGKRPTSSKYEPVTMVNWRDCIVWCNAYSEMLGYTPVYKSGWSVLKDSRDSNGDNCDNVSVNWSANGYRLPTEGEWQYAATNRGNTPWNYASGASDDWENDSACKRVAWYSENSGGETHPVGGKSSNGLGFYDMSGNVWEWCWDWYGKYPSNSRDDYRGSSTGSIRVGRGGSWYGGSGYLRGGFRNSRYPCDEDSDLGFRLARAF